MIQDILFHGRVVKQRRCDLCGKIIYLQEDVHSVRKRCRAHSRAYLMYEELNKISLGVTEYWHNGTCSHVCKQCAERTLTQMWKLRMNISNVFIQKTMMQF